jgi:hypothetical protein
MKNIKSHSTDSSLIIVFFDTHQPKPHPWEAHLPKGWRFKYCDLPIGDIAFARSLAGVVIIRLSPCQLAERISDPCFERYLSGSNYIEKLLIVVEGSLSDVHYSSRYIDINPDFIDATLAAWTIRFCPVIFAGGVSQAANFAFRALASQVCDIQRKAEFDLSWVG